MSKIYFITGIDTDAGKTYATGMLAKYMLNEGVNVTTQKLSQTGCIDISEDIEKHREIMGIELTEDDRSGLTCPYIFKYPASPHLAAEMENMEIDPDRIFNSTNILAEKYDVLLVEGVGGIHVPLNRSVSLLDYLEEKQYPLIVVSTPKLGSINHTLLTLEAAYNRGLKVNGIIYNTFIDAPEEIKADSTSIFRAYLKKFGFRDVIVELPDVRKGELDIDFGDLL